MELLEITELSTQARIDGKKLYKVSEFLFNLAIIFNWIIGLIGAALAVAMLGSEEYGLLRALGIIIIFASICIINYMLAVLSTHVAKVMVHISFASVALMENNQNKVNGE